MKRSQIHSSFKQDPNYPLHPRGPNGPESPGDSPAPGAGGDPSADPHTASEIVCAACDAHITSPGERIAVASSHEHRFMNPGGYTFHLGCFASAIGVVVVGPDSLEYPWFDGYSWRYAHCAGCGTHLGWQFRSATATPSPFLGLVLDRLRFLDN